MRDVRTGEGGTLRQAMAILRRATPRAEAEDDLYAFWYSSDGRDLSRVRNLNMGGVFVETSLPKDLGTSVELHFLAGEGPIRAKAVVRHADPGQGMGLKFTAFGEQDRLRFGALMKRLYAAHCQRRGQQKNLVQGTIEGPRHRAVVSET